MLSENSIFLLFKEMSVLEQFFEKLTEINDAINGFIWVKIGLILLIGTGILLTVSTKFFQLSHLRLWWKRTIGQMLDKKNISHTKDGASISPFQALCTALAATVGGIGIAPGANINYQTGVAVFEEGDGAAAVVEGDAGAGDGWGALGEAAVRY